MRTLPRSSWSRLTESLHRSGSAEHGRLRRPGVIADATAERAYSVADDDGEIARVCAVPDIEHWTLRFGGPEPHRLHVTARAGDVYPISSGRDRFDAEG